MLGSPRAHWAGVRPRSVQVQTLQGQTGHLVYLQCGHLLLLVSLGCRTVFLLPVTSLNLLFQSSFRFTTELRGGYRGVPCIARPYVHRLVINITPQNGIFVTTEEPTATHHNPEPSFPWGSHLVCLLWVWTNV